MTRYAAPIAILVVAVIAGSSLPLLLPADLLGPLIVLSFAVSLVPIVAVQFGRKWDPFEPAVWFMASYWVLFVMRPVADALTPGGPAAIAGLDPGPTYAAAVMVATLGALAFYLGYYATVGVRMGGALPHFARPLSSARLHTFALVASAVALALLGIFVLSAGGMPVLLTLLSGRNQFTLELLSGTGGYLFSAPLWLVGVAMLQLAVVAKWRSRTGVIAAGVLALSLVIAAPIGARSWTLAALTAVYVLYYIRQGRRPTIRAVAGLLVVVFFAGISAPREFRNSDVRDGSFIDSIVASVAAPGDAIEEFILGLDTSMVGTLAIQLQHVPDATPYRLGATYVATLARPIPRALWPEKPREGDIELMRVIWPDLVDQNVQFTFSLFGEPYFNFGIAGVLAISFLVGIFYRAMFEWLRGAPTSPVVQAIFAVTLSMVYVYARGGLGIDFHRHLMLVIPIVLAARWAGVRQPGQGRASVRVGVPATQPR